jgi:SAM-dependent methyltransferase
MGSYWAAHAKRYDEGVAAYHAHFLTAAAIGKTTRVRDIGCGTGQTTRDAARIATAGSVLGVDPGRSAKSWAVGLVRVGGSRTG